MSRLEDFLGLNDISDVRETVKVNVGGKDFEIVIRPLTDEEHNDFQKRCNTIVKNKVSFDNGKYSKLLLENCIVEPDFSNAEFLKKVGCMSAIEFLQKKFPAGTLMDIGVKIQRLSGFETFDVDINDAKN